MNALFIQKHFSYLNIIISIKNTNIKFPHLNRIKSFLNHKLIQANIVKIFKI